MPCSKRRPATALPAAPSVRRFVGVRNLGCRLASQYRHETKILRRLVRVAAVQQPGRLRSVAAALPINPSGHVVPHVDVQVLQIDPAAAELAAPVNASVAK